MENWPASHFCPQLVSLGSHGGNAAGSAIADAEFDVERDNTNGPGQADFCFNRSRISISSS